MTITKKPARTTSGKKEASSGGRVHHEGTKSPGLDGRHRDEGMAPGQLRQANEMLSRIERKGRELSASAEKLLRRVS